MRITRPFIPLIGLTAVAVFTISIFLLNSGQYQALGSGVQAVGVLVALALGVSTLQADSKDRRVDRVITYHSQISGGELQLARHEFAGWIDDVASCTPESSRVVDWQGSITRDFGALPSAEGSTRDSDGS